jgi:hypothetical protein
VFDINNRVVSLYLPQYHPIPENDLWWGKGFTEWTNVVRAKPLYKRHYQPQLPADLGFYDLRLNEVMVQQAELARAHGIYGFCFYHYWFNGKRLLERPTNNLLDSGKPDFPFMYCWANENWTRRWDGDDQQVLIKQEYCHEDDIRHIEHLIPVFKDHRYIRVDDKPVFIVYRPWLMPDIYETVATWRRVAKEHGLDLYLCHMVFGYGNDWDKLLPCFDAAIDFEPFGIRHGKSTLFKDIKSMNVDFRMLSLVERFRKLFFNQYPERYKLNIKSYESIFSDYLPLNKIPFKMFPGLCPGWDNTPRRGNSPSLILHGANPDKFEDWLAKIIEDFTPYSKDENFIFINAWNEWAEGNHLEPCSKYGLDYLKAIKKMSS